MKVFKHIAMLSTHGFFDPIPQLGRTDTGGQVVFVLELAKALSKLGIKVDIYTRWFEKDKPAIEVIPGFPDVRVIRIHSGPWEFIPKELIYDQLDEIASNMLSFIKKEGLDYDLFHGHYVDAGIVGLTVANALNKPVYFTAHSLGAWKRDQMGGDPTEMEKQFNFNHRIDEEMRIFKAVNAQTLTSIVQLEKLETLYPFKKDNIEIIPPGVDISSFFPVAADFTYDFEPLAQRYIYCLSRIDSNKGHDMLLDAFALVAKEVPDISLVIGGGSNNPKKVEQEVFDMMDGIIAKHQIADRIRFIRHIPDNVKAQYYRQAEFFVLPSLFEPFGMTAIESMACGRPVIASKFGGIRNTIRHEENGLLVDPRDPQEFADYILQLLNNNDYCNQLGNTACDLVREEYSWEAIAQKFIGVFQKYV